MEAAHLSDISRCPWAFTSRLHPHPRSPMGTLQGFAHLFRCSAVRRTHCMKVGSHLTWHQPQPHVPIPASSRIDPGRLIGGRVSQLSLGSSLTLLPGLCLVHTWCSILLSSGEAGYEKSAPSLPFEPPTLVWLLLLLASSQLNFGSPLSSLMPFSASHTCHT